MEKKKYVWILVAVWGMLSIFAWLKTDGEVSVTERRKLKTFPTISVERVVDGRFMEEFEEYTVDQFPFREEFRRLKAWNHLGIFRQKDNHDVYKAEGYLSELDPVINKKALGRSIGKIENIYERYIRNSDAKTYYVVIPDKNYFLAKKSGHPTYDYSQLFASIETELDMMESVEITGMLEIQDYYMTDNHWRQEKIEDVAKKLLEAMNTTNGAPYEKHLVDTPFYGVYYGRYGLQKEADEIKYLTNAVTEACIVTNQVTGTSMPMYDMELAKGRDAYEMFLGGAQSVITIENPNAETERELVLFRDSFGSSIAPLLVEGYAKITLLDIRYLNENMIGEFVEFTDQDVLFLYSTSVLNGGL